MGSKVVRVVSKHETESVRKKPIKKEKPRDKPLEFSHNPFETALRHLNIEGERKKDIK
jgi:hypothetical protein